MKGFQIRWQNRAQDGAAVIPQATEGPAQPVERNKRFLTVLAGTVAFQAQKRLHALRIYLFQEEQQKGINQQHDPQEFEAIVQRPQTWTLQGQCAFAIAKTGFERPSAFVGKKDLPGLSFVLHALIGNQITDFPSESRFDQVELLRVFGMANRCPPEIAGDFQTTAALTDQLVGHIPLAASNLPQFLGVAFLSIKMCFLIQRLMKRTRKRSKTSSHGPEAEPRSKTKVSSGPQRRTSSSISTHFGGIVAFGRPPAHHGQAGNALQAGNDGASPLHAYHSDGPQAWQVKEQAQPGAVQPFGFAGEHGCSSFQLAAFRFFEHTAIKQAENALPLSFESLHLLAGFLQQKAINVLGTPFERAQQLPQALGASSRR